MGNLATYRTRAMSYLIREKRSGKSDKIFCKWLNFSLTKFFPEFLFPDQYFSPIFFNLTKNLSQFFFNYYYYYYYSYLFGKFIITTFFLCTLFFVVEQNNFNKNFEMQVTASNWKNNKKLYIHKLQKLYNFKNQ